LLDFAKRDGHIKTAQANKEHDVALDLYYFAAWTDSGYLLGCEHHHQTVISAANCISEAGGYVIAVEKGKLRTLNDAEEKLFRVALYGAETSRLIIFKPGSAFKLSLN